MKDAIRRFLDEDIPASAGWHQVFGGVATFLFCVQAFTGVLLALNYAPTPPDAYNSLRYILIEVTGGPLIRGLHHWGSSMMVIVVGLHLVQVFIYGAYKPPRQATWIAGVGLLLLTLAYGLTGYLLPWDNRAYWGTVVVTQIAANVPLAGPWLARLLGSEGHVGAVTFSRFYAVHVTLLPPLTALLIVVHIWLVRKHGVTPQPGDEVRPTKKFYPGQVLKDTLAIFAAFAVLFVLAVAVRAPLERLADPTDTSAIPRPEWYFLFLLQLLTYLEGPLEAVGTVLLPTLAVLALILVPFVDRGRVLPVARRFVAFAIVVLAVIGWTGLTVAAMASTPRRAAEIDFTRPTDWMTLPPDRAVHAADAPAFVTAGASLYQKHYCASCHMVNGVGSKLGPALNGLSRRRTRSWVEQHFRTPQALSPGTIMPPYKFKQQELEQLTSYLFTLP